MLSVIFSLHAQDVDKILKNYFEAIGQDNKLKTKTMTFTGNVIQGGMKIPFVMYQARPFKFRMDLTIQDQKVVQVFDGEDGWYINPMMGASDPQDMGPDQIRQSKSQADFDGELYNYKEKGSTLEYIGTEDVNEAKAYKVKFTDKEGNITFYYFDTEIYVLLKTVADRTMQGQVFNTEATFDDYQMIEGMAFPFSLSTSVNGQVIMEMIFEKVEFDKDLDNSLFSKPVKE